MRSSARRCAVTRTSASVLVLWAVVVARPSAANNAMTTAAARRARMLCSRLGGQPSGAIHGENYTPI